MTVGTINELQAVPAGLERITAAGEYIRAREDAIRQARAIRNGDIRDLVAQHGPAKAARMTGLSVTTIKIVRGGGQ